MAKKNRHRSKCGMSIFRSSYNSYNRYGSYRNTSKTSPIDHDNNPTTEGDSVVSSPAESEELKAWGKLVGPENVAKTLGKNK